VQAFKFPEYPVADSSREQNENVDHPTKESILGGYLGQLSKIMKAKMTLNMLRHGSFNN